MRNSAEKTFHVSTLEKIYLEKLTSFGIHKTSHTTRFSRKLTGVNCGVVPVQKQEGFPHCAVKTDSFDDVILNPMEWMQLLRKVVVPLRTEILSTKSENDMTKLDYTSESSEIKSYKLRLLLSMVLEDNPRVSGLSKPTETIGQLITMNCKKFHRPSRPEISDETVTRHSRADEVPTVQYLSLKLYTVIRSKSLIQAFFHYGVVCPMIVSILL